MTTPSNNPVLRRHALALELAETAGRRTLQYICQGRPDHAAGAARVAYDYGSQALEVLPQPDLIAEARWSVRAGWTRDEFELAARIAYDNAVADAALEEYSDEGNRD